MATRRTYGSYNDGCAAAHALDLIGDRWTMIVVRELLLGPKRFRDLQRDVLGIGPTVLTRRLQELVDHGIAERRQLGGPGRPEAYALTPWGQRLEQVNNALALWAVASPALPWDADMSPDTLVLALRAHARPCPGLAQARTVALELTDSRLPGTAEPATYLATLASTGTAIERSDGAEHAAARLTATTRDLKAAVFGDAGPDAPGLSVSGDRDAVALLLAATRPTDPAPAPAGSRRPRPARSPASPG